MRNIKFSASANGQRNAGLGGGANLRAQNLFTADDMHIDGLYWVRPYDMENDFGSEGAAIAAIKGCRYAFFISSDHHDNNFGWARGGGIWCGWGNDPGNYPSPDAFRLVAASSHVDSSGFTVIQNETPWLVYNPDDLPDHPFHLYVHAVSTNALGQRTFVFRSDDMDNWTVVAAPTHANGVGWPGHVGYQQVTRNGTGDWESIGLGNRTSTSGNSYTRWTSTDGLTFTAASDLDTRVATSDFIIHDGVVVTIGAQQYRITREDHFDTTLVANPNSTPGATRIGQYVSAVPVGATGSVSTNDANDVIRISSRYAGEYPGPNYLQSVSGYAEDGVAHIWATHGFFSDVGLVAGASYANGGGYDDELVDYYTYIYNATDAAQAAPVGVRWTCSGGVVTLDWYNALPNNTYRVYRGTTVGTQATLIGDVTGTSITNSPGTGIFYYKVVTMEGATERGHRIIRVYSSSNSALINKHIDRVTAAGVTSGTIDESWLTDVEEWLDSEGLKSNLLYWADPAFGCIKDGSNVLSKVFCLGTTLKPRGGDYTPVTTSTTYSATGLNSTVPAWVNGSNVAHGYFGSGRLNNIRRKTALTLVAVYQKSGTGTATLLATGEFNAGINLQNTSGSPGSASLFVGNSWTATATGSTLTNGVAHIIGGTITATEAIAYVEGVAGTPAACTDATPMRGQLGTGQTFFLGSGSYGLKNTAGATVVDVSGSYSFSNNQASFTASDLIVFDAALSSAQMASLNVLLRARIGA